MAREKALENKRLVISGVDPTAKKRTIPAFSEAAREFHKANIPGWRNGRHTDAWIATLERHSFPVIGDLPVDKIQQEHVLAVLNPIWGTKQETARRVRQRMRSTFRWAMGYRFIESNPAGEAIDGVLPRMPKFKEHLKALHYQDVSAALQTVTNSKASYPVKLCFEFTVYTAARSGEARGARWEEIDLEAREWRVPASRMKAGFVHRVPLSGLALDVLARALALKDDSGLVFPSPSGKTLSDSTISKLLRENGIEGVPHGFRSSFRDWAAENTSATWAAMEMCLAHAVGSDVVRSYARSDLLEKRRELMDAWAEYLDNGNRVS
jgi:integrase